MSNRVCPKCGEEYSDTYKKCPFCQEEEAIRQGHPPHRHSHKETRRQSGGAGGVLLLVVGVLLAGVVGFLFFGDRVTDAVGIRGDTTGEPLPAETDPADPADAAGNGNEAPGAGEGVKPPVSKPPEQTSPDSQTGNHPGAAAVVPPVTIQTGPLTLSQTDITIAAGDTARLTASGGQEAVTWSSSNENIATVADGSVTGQAGGKVTITAVSGEETATCQVKVEGDPWVDPNPSTYRLSKDDFTLSPSETTWQMKVKKDNGKWEIMGPDQGVTWASNNTSVVTISETGLVTKTGKGTTQITATVGGVTLECTVRMS